MTTGVGESARGTRHGGTSRAVLLRRVLAGVILLAWLTWLVPSWMSSLNEVRARDVVQDIRSGRVVGFVAADEVRPQTMRFSALGTTWESDTSGADADGRPIEGSAMHLVYSVKGDVRLRWLPEQPPAIGDQDVFAALKASGARPFAPGTLPPNRDWASLPALFATIAAVVSLLSTAPTRGTRPFWVLAGTLGMGLGIVAYAVADLARPAPAASGGEAPPLRWWHGLLGGVLVAALRAVIT